MYLYMTEIHALLCSDVVTNDEIEKIELKYLEHNKFKGFGEYKHEILKQNES